MGGIGQHEEFEQVSLYRRARWLYQVDVVPAYALFDLDV